MVEDSRNNKHAISIQNTKNINIGSQDKESLKKEKKEAKINFVCKANAVKLEEKNYKSNVNIVTKILTERSNKKSVILPDITKNSIDISMQQGLFQKGSLKLLPKKHKKYKKKIYVTLDASEDSSKEGLTSFQMENYGNKIS